MNLLDFMLIDVQQLINPKFSNSTQLTDDDALTTCFGTQGYMAPEQKDEGIVTKRSDIYSLGIVFAFLSGGMERVFNSEEDNPLGPLILSMVHHIPEKRPSAKEVLIRLEKVARELDINLP